MRTQITTRRAVILVLLLAMGSPAIGQDARQAPKNKLHRPSRTVQIGEKAAAEVRHSYPVIQNPEIQRYMTTLGERLVDAAPRELNNPAFRYSFTPVNVKEINAFCPARRTDVHQPRDDRFRAHPKVKWSA
jgi:predicted Zn-dependent protease